MIQIKTTLLAALLGSLTLGAQQPRHDYDFQKVAAPGTTIGEITLPLRTTIDGTALGNSGQYAFIARWPTFGGSHQAAILTSTHVVVEEGDVVGGKIIADIPAHAHILISETGDVAYEALYADSSADAVVGKDHRGVFFKRELVYTAQLTALDVEIDFVLGDDGKVHVSGFDTQSSSRLPSTAPAIPTAQKFQGVFDRIHVIPPKLLRGFPISINPGPIGKLSSPAPGQLNQTAPTKRNIATEIHSAGPCPMPNFPLPIRWGTNDYSAAIASRLDDHAVAGRSFDAQFPYLYGRLKTPFRVILFDSECLPRIVAIGDESYGYVGGIVAVYTSHGLVASLGPDQGLAFGNQTSGFDAPPSFIETTTEAFSQTGDLIRINRSGQVLVTAHADGRASLLLLGTPVAK